MMNSVITQDNQTPQLLADSHHLSPAVGAGHRGTAIGGAADPSGSFLLAGQGAPDGGQRLYNNLGNNAHNTIELDSDRRIEINNNGAPNLIVV